MPFPIALAASLIPAAVQGIQGIGQRIKANNLKESTFIPPELQMNQQLAQQQAFSRRAPGAANAESMNRRAASNQISAGQRSFGGDANKSAAVTAGAVGQLNDANARIASQGEQFSEGAYGRLANANAGIANQKRQNRDEYNRAKEALLYGSDQNLFNAANNIGTSVIAGVQSGDIGGGGSKGVPTLGGQLGAISGVGQTRGAGWNDYLNNKAIQQFGYDPYQQDAQFGNQGNVWGRPGYSPMQYPINLQRSRMGFRKPY